VLKDKIEDEGVVKGGGGGGIGRSRYDGGVKGRWL
jgi:hypothetical protein